MCSISDTAPYLSLSFSFSDPFMFTRRYLMDGAESNSEESEAEEEEESEEEREKGKGKAQKEVKQATPKKLPVKREEGDEEDEFGGSTDVEEAGNDDSGMDTEDELKRAESESRRRRGPEGRGRGPGASEDPYAGSTDENTDAEAEEDKPIPELPDFLTGKRFFLYGKFPPSERRLLLRYIVAFNGSVEDYMSEKVQFVITSEGWHDSFEDALMENGGLSFVKPSWIFSINERQKMLPYQPYTVVP
ncbi:hypothetical protein ANANG_G00002900 [Anguilla anguilla]|uniref:BRCT domain-containing protein n=1 Tax=Anguilla anguilla TaxID=7936 RepID=A0A9D3MZ43_ANGAN|nr:hypothetical protein ANANG_G00002900 [Anguilla anguilla]